MRCNQSRPSTASKPSTSTSAASAATASAALPQTTLVDGSGAALSTRRIWSEPSARTEVASKNPELVFDFELDEGPVPYRYEGDEDMYTPDAITARKKLKHNPRIIAAMDEFWDCYAKDASGRISWDEYRNVYLKMCKALNTAQNGFDREESERLAKIDFDRDTKGYETLNRAMIRNSLFELADLWTRTIEVDDYVGFLV